MNTLIFESRFPCGKFDHYLNILEGNQAIYRIIGSGFYDSLYHLVQESDQPALRSAVESCIATHSEKDCLIHIPQKDGSEKGYLSVLRPALEEDALFIELFSVQEQMERCNRLELILQLSRDYFSLAGMILMYYLPSSGLFKLYWLNNEQEIDLYRMPLDAWILQMEQEKRIYDTDLDAFHSLCDALRKHDQQGTFCFRCSILTDPNQFDSCRVTIRSQTINGNEHILGLWTVENSAASLSYTENNYMDSLTGLLDKKSITDYAKRLINNPNEPSVALAIIDIDNFKNFNDSYGHMFGDEVIRATADMLKKVLTNKGVAGRIGGDEFMVILKNNGDNQELRNYLRAIKTNIKLLFSERLGKSFLTCSTGAAVSKLHASNYNDLFQLADKCLYLAKQKGKNRYVIYTPELHGFLSNTPADMSIIKDSFYSHRDLHEINSLIMKLIMEGSSALQPLLDLEAKTLLVDRLHIFWGKPAVCRAANELYYTDSSYLRLLDEKEYLSIFDDDIMTIINTNHIEYSNPPAYKFFKAHHVCSTMQHLLRDNAGNICGLVTADQCTNIHTFPQIAIQLFDSFCTTINAVFLRES